MFYAGNRNLVLAAKPEILQSYPSYPSMFGRKANGHIHL